MKNQRLIVETQEEKSMTEKLLNFVVKYWKEINGYGKPTYDTEYNQIYVVIPIDVLLDTLDISFDELSNLERDYRNNNQ